MLKNKFLLCLVVVLCLVLKKFEFLQTLLPKQLLQKLPLGWTDRMYWTVLESRGQKIYADIPCQLKSPQTCEPKVTVGDAYRLTAADIRCFYENGYLGPFTLISPPEAESLRAHLERMLKTESTIYETSFRAIHIVSA